MVPVNYVELYNNHPEYGARRQNYSFEHLRAELEVEYFKLPNFMEMLCGWVPYSVLEIGCATGELIADFPVHGDGRRVGVDISDENIKIARERFPQHVFYAGDFRYMGLENADVVILSDVLEHVPDDISFLAESARLGKYILINLPLECNWLNRNRHYGPDDVSGHLRAYTLQHGFEMIRSAGLSIIRWKRVWFHETEAEDHFRNLRKKQFGAAYAGGRLGRITRRATYAVAEACPPIGRRLFSSNLFVLAKC